MEPIQSNDLILCLIHDMHTTWDALGALWEQGAMATAQLCLTCYCSLSQLSVGVFWTCSYIFYQLFVFSFFFFSLVRIYCPTLYVLIHLMSFFLIILKLEYTIKVLILSNFGQIKSQLKDHSMSQTMPWEIVLGHIKLLSGITLSLTS